MGLMLTIYPEKYYPEAKNFCNLFLNETAIPRYVFGRNEYAASIANFVDVTGFIDEFTNKKSYLGKPVVKIADLPKDSMVVSAVVLGRPLIALNKLKSNGLNGLDYFAFLKYSGLAFKEIEVLYKGKEDIKINRDKYEWVYNRLKDETSKHVLEKLLNFRFSYDLNYMKGFKHTPDRQYFEDFLGLKPGEVFVDGGGFDGQTVINLIERCPDYQSIYFFEPDPKNVIIARNNLSEYPNIYFYTLGLAESKKTLRFGSGAGAASKICETGDIEIQVDSIDNLINEPISFIKMDIEGSEEIAIEGAKNHIRNDHPKLAICCYHKFDDIWKIPEQVLAIRDDYAIYLRHYTEGTTETVIYFIPDV